MQNKTDLNTHNELIPGSEPWHRGSGFTWMLLALAGAVFFLSGAVAKAAWEDVNNWKDNSSTGDWNSASWYNNSQGWDNHNPNYEGYRNLSFNNNNNTSMNNNFTGDGARRWRVTFNSGANLSRTIGGSTENTFAAISGHGDAIIQNNSGVNHTMNFPIRLNSGLQINPVDGNLTIGGAINLQSHYIDVWGNNDKVLRLNGAVSGSGGISVQQNSTLELAGDNSYSGTTTINNGKIRIINGGDLGTSLVQIGANGQLDLNNVNTTVKGVKEVGYGNAGSVALGSATLTVSGADQGTLHQGNISGTGGLTVSGSGTTLALSGSQSYTGATTVSAGKITTSVAMGSSSYSVNGGEFETTADGAIANNASISLTAGDFKIGGNDTVGSINATGGRLTVSNGKTAYLSANSLIGSGAEILGGKIEANSGTTLTVNSVDTDNTSALSVASGGTLTGSFRTSGALSVDGVFAPGNSTGISYVGATTFLGGGRYQWEIDTFGPGAVVGTNWDFLSISDTLTINATSGDKFWIDIVSLLASNDLTGEASGFNLTSNYSFAIATAANGISGFNADAFGINIEGFQNYMGASPAYAPGVWSVSTSGNSLMLNYAGATAIPEPSSAALTLLGMGVLALRRRCRR